jgi:hypothetical protein
MVTETTVTKMVWDMTPEELHEFLGVMPEGILKVSETELVDDYSAGVTNNAERWKKRAAGTRKDIVALGIAAEGKYANKMKEVIANQTRAKALKGTSTAEVIAAINATPASTYSDGATARLPKLRKKWALMYPLREFAKQQLDLMPQDTDGQREKKMISAKRTNQAVGQFMKGVTDVSACRAAIVAACK